MLTNQPFLFEGHSTQDHACLCLHGLGGGIFELELLAQHLHDQGLSVRGFNYPGHDVASIKMPPSSWSQWYDRSVQNYHDLRQRYAKISIIGFSTGCPLGLYLAAHYPVHKLVLLSPFLRLRRRWYYLFPLEYYLYSLGSFIADVPRLRIPICDPEMRAAGAKVLSFRSFNLAAVRSALALIEQVKTELPAIEAPILILQSHQDSVVDPEGARYYFQQIGSSHKDLHWLQRSDHGIGLDLERDQVLAKVSSFLLSSDQD